MAQQPLPSFHIPPLFHNLLFLPAILLRLHLLILQGFLLEYTLAQVT